MNISAARKGREPNGRKSRRKADVKARAAESEESARSVVVEARIRQGLPLKWASDPRAGTVQGKLHIIWQGNPDDERGLDADQFEAADWYLIKLNDYLIAMDAPGAHYDRDEERSGTGEPDAHERFCRSARAKWSEIMDALSEANVLGAGKWNLVAALHTMLVQQAMVAHMIGDLRIALNVIHRVRSGRR
jgi:hypothetical protein